MQRRGRQVDALASPHRAVGGDDHLGAAERETFGQWLDAVPRERRRDDGADAGHRQHRDHRFGNDRQVHRHHVTAPHAEATEPGRRPADVGRQLGERQRASFSAIGLPDDRGDAGVTPAVDGQPRDVRARPHEPAPERLALRRVVHHLPRAEPLSPEERKRRRVVPLGVLHRPARQLGHVCHSQVTHQLADAVTIDPVWRRYPPVRVEGQGELGHRAPRARRCERYGANLARVRVVVLAWRPR